MCCLRQRYLHHDGSPQRPCRLRLAWRSLRLSNHIPESCPCVGSFGLVTFVEDMDSVGHDHSVWQSPAWTAREAVQPTAGCLSSKADPLAMRNGTLGRRECNAQRHIGSKRLIGSVLIESWLQPERPVELGIGVSHNWSSQAIEYLISAYTVRSLTFMYLVASCTSWCRSKLRDSQWSDRSLRKENCASHILPR